MYRCEAATAVGFVQQLACSYLLHGYHHYVVGELPEYKDPRSGRPEDGGSDMR